MDPETEDVKPKKKIESTSIDQASPAGIRQVRIGTFEDSGKCKGCVNEQAGSANISDAMC